MSTRVACRRRSRLLSIVATATAVATFGACGAASHESTSPTSGVATQSNPAVSAAPTTAAVVGSTPTSSLAPMSSVPPSTTVSPLASAPDLGSALLDPDDHDPGVMPAQLSVPSISLRAAQVVPVGFEDNGDLEVPGVEVVGWYRFGAALQRPGSVVLAAHIAFDGVDGVFRRLADVDVGDEVSITGADGADYRYRIDSVERFRKDALPDDRIWSTTGPPGLVLITCGGRFDRSAGHYEDNVVAFASPL